MPANTPSESQPRKPCQFPRQGNIQVLQVAADGLPNPGFGLAPGTAIDRTAGQGRAPGPVRSIVGTGDSDRGFHLPVSFLIVNLTRLAPVSRVFGAAPAPTAVRHVPRQAEHLHHGASREGLHHDISTVTGEEVVIFTLAMPPVFRDAKRE